MNLEARKYPIGHTKYHDQLSPELIKVMIADMAALPADLAIFAAAVADWRVKNVGGEKLKKQAWSDGLKLDFTENPDILKTNPLVIEKHVKETVAKMPNAKKGYILNLGHGVDQFTPVENVAHFVKVAQSF